MHRQPLMNGQTIPSIRPALCDYITPHPSLTAPSNLLPFFLSDNIQTRLPTRLLTLPHLIHTPYFYKAVCSAHGLARFCFELELIPLPAPPLPSPPKKRLVKLRHSLSTRVRVRWRFCFEL